MDEKKEDCDHLSLREDDEKLNKEAAVDKKEEARQKLKELINKNRDRAKDVTKRKENERKESDGDKDVDLRAMLEEKRSRGEERERESAQLKAMQEREKREREKESDGDWHCGDQDCRFINFKKNHLCKKCDRPPPIEPVFWDIPELSEPKKKKKSDKRRKSSDERRKSSSEGRRKRRESSQDSQLSEKEEFRDLEISIKEDPGLLNFSNPDSSMECSPSSLSTLKVSSPADLLSSSKGFSGEEGQEVSRSRHSSRASNSRPCSRSQVTSFLDDIGDSFEDEPSKNNNSGRSRTNSPLQSKEDEDFKKPLDFGDRISNDVGDIEDAFEKKVKEYTNDSDGESVAKDGAIHSSEDINSITLKLEDVSSQEFSSSQDDSLTSHNESKSDCHLEANEESEKVEGNDPKYSWKDRSRTSEEFELSLEINDKDFLETVKSEYRSSSPSWANKKFKFPIKKEKPDKKVDEALLEFDEEKTVERSVSVRKRMQDEIKKEQDIKVEKLESKEEKLDVETSSKEDDNTQTMDQLKIKGESLRRKDRQYRSSKDELNSSTEKEDGREDRKRDDRSNSRTHEREEDRYERKKREERQKERDRKERERNEKIREEEEERRRRRKLEEERRKDELRKFEEEKRREKKRIEEREREDRERRKIEDEERKRKRAEESRRKREELEDEKRRLHEERMEIERKELERKEVARKREKEKLLAERRERDNRKRSRSRSLAESSQIGKKVDKKLAKGDLRKRLEDKKKKVSKKPEKKVKKKKKRDSKESSSSSSSDSSSSSSSAESESEDSDPAQQILKDKVLLKKILELATKNKKKKSKKKKKSSRALRDSPQDKNVAGHRRVVLAGRDNLTMQLNTSQDDDSPVREESKKKTIRSPVKKRSRGSVGPEIDVKKHRSDSLNSGSDEETIQINIRNSPALERMNKKKMSVPDADSSEDDARAKKMEKNRPRSSSPSPCKAR